MFTAALVTTAKTWKQPRCPSAEEWMKMWCIHTGILLSHKQNEAMPCAAIWRDLEIITLSEASQKEKDKYMISLYMESKIWQYDTNELNYETDSQTQRTDLWEPSVGEGCREAGVSRCKLLYMEWINKVLLYSTGNYIPYPIINYNGKEYKKNVWIHMNIYVQLNHFSVQQKWIQCYKSTILC